ncbi:MAG: zinc ribbon domain-containing protein [Dehalococcoidia bacterium]|nr:zinc ribbon domain-containing protein [Dehalococcoidia bacterium]
MLKRLVLLLGLTFVALVAGLTIVPSLLGLGNLADTASNVCDRRVEAFVSSGALLPVAASSIAGVLLGSLLFWKPERGEQERNDPDQTRFCTNCGTGNEPDWVLCPFCGQSVRPVKQTSGETISDD